MQFSQLIKMKDSDKPIFVKSRVFNSTINNRLKVLCENANIPTITVHSLRHTHASLLLFAGVSIASVANRLGHSSMTTTQEHIFILFRNWKIKIMIKLYAIYQC